LWSGVPALGVIVARWAMGLPDGVELGGHEAVGAADEVPPVTGLLLVGRTLAGLAPSTRVLRQPCEATFVDLGASEPMVWLGAIALVGLPMVTRRISDPVASSGLWWLWAILVASSQIAEPLPSALSPALGAVASIGLAVALTALAVSRNAQIALLAMALLMGGVSTIQARTSLKGELDALEAGVEQCPTSAAPLVRLARYYVAQGQATRALELLDGVEGDTAAGLRVELFLARGSWGRARREVSLLTGDSALEWQCRTGALMREVSAVRSCVAAREALGDERELVAAHAQALQRDRRTAEAEALLREQLAARPADPVLNEGLASLLEQASWMRQAVEALEAWYVLDNSQYVLKRLVSALVRKGKGDLVGGRATEARKAFERALVLAPDEHEVRYHLARALEDGGDLAGAKRERARAASAGAKPPVSPLQMRGMPPLDER